MKASARVRSGIKVAAGRLRQWRELNWTQGRHNSNQLQPSGATMLNNIHLTYFVESWSLMGTVMLSLVKEMFGGGHGGSAMVGP